MFDKKPAVRPGDEQDEVNPVSQADVETEAVEPGTEALAQGFAKLRHRGMMRRDDSAMFRDPRLIEWMAKDARDGTKRRLERRPLSPDHGDRAMRGR